MIEQTTSSLGLGVLLHPLGCGGLPCVTVALPCLRDAHLLCILCIRRFHDSQDGLNDKFSVESWNPVLVDGLRANLTCVRLHAGMVDLGHELDLGWLEWIVVSKVKVDSESTANEGGALWTFDVDVPNHHVILSGLDSDAWDWCTCQITQFLVINKNG